MMSDFAAELSIENLTVASAGKIVVENMSLSVIQGEIVALLGPNGAGKSELVLATAGLMAKESGSVTVAGNQVSALKPDQIRVAGLAAVPEGHQVLPDLSVSDNLCAAGSMLSAPDLDRAIHDALELFPELDRLLAQKAGLLSGGQQKMVALAQALVCRPRFLLIDEMSLGLAPVIIKRLLEAMRQLSKKGVGILLIEQFTNLALELSNRAIIMNRGRMLYSGDSKKLRDNPDILHSAYFGT